MYNICENTCVFNSSGIYSTIIALYFQFIREPVESILISINASYVFEFACTWSFLHFNRSPTESTDCLYVYIYIWNLTWFHHICTFHEQSVSSLSSLWNVVVVACALIIYIVYYMIIRFVWITFKVAICC